jgi:hypothetical protein
MAASEKKALRTFRKLIESHGMTIERSAGGHYRVCKNGRLVASVSCTGERNTLKASVRDLTRQQLLPTECKRIVF